MFTGPFSQAQYFTTKNILIHRTRSLCIVALYQQTDRIGMVYKYIIRWQRENYNRKRCIIQK